MTNNEQLLILARRCDRLVNEYEVNAPSIIKKTELGMIIDICNLLLGQFEAE